jgi:hypothetical protein
MTPKDALDIAKLVGTVSEYAWADSPGWELVRQRFSATARVERLREKYHMEWWGEFWDLLRKHHAQLDEAEANAAWARIRDEPEACMLLANYVEDAYREPLRRRRLMLQHAVVGMFNLDLSLGDLVRIWRVIRQLDERDVLTLYGVWLIPSRDFQGWPSGAVQYRATHSRAGLDALAACGAVEVYRPSTSPTRPELTVTATGKLILAGLRTFLAVRTPPFEVPGHEVTSEFRSEPEARAILAATPLEVLRRYSNKRFSGAIDYDGLDLSVHHSPRGKTRLVVKMSRSDATELQHALGRKDPVKRGDPVDSIYVEEILPDPEGSATHELVLVAGPYDLVRYLAYDLFARWWTIEWFRNSSTPRQRVPGDLLPSSTD